MALLAITCNRNSIYPSSRAPRTTSTSSQLRPERRLRLLKFVAYPEILHDLDTPSRDRHALRIPANPLDPLADAPAGVRDAAEDLNRLARGQLERGGDVRFQERGQAAEALVRFRRTQALVRVDDRLSGSREAESAMSGP